MACILLTLIGLTLAYDVARFHAVVNSEHLATLSISATGPTTFLLEFANADGEKWYTSLSGDAWQLHIRGLSFSGFASVLASSPVARIHSVSNRYYDFANRHRARTVVVAPSYIDSLFTALKFDVWLMLKRVFGLLGAIGIEHQEQDSAVVPLVDGAVYFADWVRTYISIEPANEIARLSLQADDPTLLPGSEAE